MILLNSKNWKVQDFYVVDSMSQGSDPRVDALTFWNSRVDDFQSNLGLSIEGYGHLQFRISALDHTLRLEITSQNATFDASVLSKFPIDHIVIEEKWVPLEIGEVSKYRTFIEENRLNLGQKVGISEYVKILTGKNNGIIDFKLDKNLSFLEDLVQIKSIDSGLELNPYPYIT